MAVPLVLDTNSLQDRDFRFWLENYHGRKVIPAVAYTELCVYFIRRKNKTTEDVDILLRKMSVEVDWYRHGQAKKAAEMGARGDFSSKARDFMIAAHAYTAPWILVTYNVDDFDYLERRVMTPKDVMRSQ